MPCAHQAIKFVYRKYRCGEMCAGAPRIVLCRWYHSQKKKSAEPTQVLPGATVALKLGRDRTKPFSLKTYQRARIGFEAHAHRILGLEISPTELIGTVPSLVCVQHALLLTFSNLGISNLGISTTVAPLGNLCWNHSPCFSTGCTPPLCLPNPMRRTW